MAASAFQKPPVDQRIIDPSLRADHPSAGILPRWWQQWFNDLYQFFAVVLGGFVTGPASATAGHLAVFSGTTGKVIVDGGPVPSAASANTTAAAPTGTTSLVGVMMGLAASITPTQSGTVLVTVCGEVSNASATAGDGGAAQIRHGTGAAPANGAALTGTAVGTLITGVLTRAVADPVPFSLCARITGLTVGVAAWVDVSLAAVTAGTAAVTNVSLTIGEV